MSCLTAFLPYDEQRRRIGSDRDTCMVCGGGPLEVDLGILGMYFDSLRRDGSTLRCRCGVCVDIVVGGGG